MFKWGFEIESAANEAITATAMAVSCVCECVVGVLECVCYQQRVKKWNTNQIIKLRTWNEKEVKFK